MDSNSEGLLRWVHPELAAKIQQVELLLANDPRFAGESLVVTAGVRSWLAQEVAWSKGRQQQADGTWTVVDPAAVVTHAPPGHSWHNFGLAVDLAPASTQQFGAIDWNPAHDCWKAIIAAVEAAGLVSGATFHDLQDDPHAQLTGRFPVSPDDEVRQLFQDGGMQAVWDETGPLANRNDPG